MAVFRRPQEIPMVHVFEEKMLNFAFTPYDCLVASTHVPDDAQAKNVFSKNVVHWDDIHKMSPIELTIHLVQYKFMVRFLYTSVCS